MLRDAAIADRSLLNDMIVPFAEKQVSQDEQGKKIVSYGLSSYGYDARLANQFKAVKRNIGDNPVIDPLDENHADIWEEFTSDGAVYVPAHGFVLARTVERFKIPRDVLVVCLGKSTYARCGILVTMTPLEPEWEGYVTLEICNVTDFPAKIYPNQGICQFVFLTSEKECKVSYADKAGKYQNQEGVSVAKV